MTCSVIQITDRFQNEIVNGGLKTSLEIDNGDFVIGECFWMNNISDDSYSGMYEVIGIIV